MQIKDQKDMIQRSVFYSSKLMSEQIYTAKTYLDIKRVIMINILDYNIFKESKEYHNVFVLKNNKSNDLLTNLLEYHFIELPKFEKSKDSNENDIKLSQWLNFINGRERGKVKMAIKENNNVAKAQQKYEYLTGDEELKRIEEITLFTNLDKNTQIARAKQEGIQEGIQEGAQSTKKDLIKNMLANKMDIELIMKVVNLTKEEILKIAKS